jgi:hypothetical protein
MINEEKDKREPWKPISTTLSGINREIDSNTKHTSTLWHDKDCKCTACIRTLPVICPWADCERVLPHTRYLAQHLRGHRRAEQKRKYRQKQLERTVRPDGYGFIKRALESKFDTNHLSRFAATLFTSAPGMLKRQHLHFGKTARRKLQEIELNPNQWHKETIHLPGFVLSTAYSLAQRANVLPSVGLVALLTYGVQHLIEELRSNPGKLPEPRITTTIKSTKPTPFIPGDE